jgi:hypothetical protein
MGKESDKSEKRIPRQRVAKWILLVFSGILLSILICYFVLSIIASNRMLEVYNTQLQQVEINSRLHYSDTLSQSVAGLVGKKTFLESQLSMLDNDSVSLLVDLKDSVIALVLEGVTIHTAVIIHHNYSRFFDALSNDAYARTFSRPFIVENYRSSIVKEPITIKEAPKDTLEAASFFEMPDTVVNEFVAVNMWLNQGFLLTLRQVEKLPESASNNNRFFFLALRLQKVRTDLRRLLHFRLPGYEPEINISLQKDELVTLFRALPGSTMVTIRLR